jgi:hypothetical protein
MLGSDNDAVLAAPNPLRSIVSTGNSSNRIDMVFLGDGYTASQIATTYTSGIQNYLSYIFDDSALTQPFGRYERFFNIWAIDVVSNQSGADDPSTGTVRDTALDATYRYDGVTQRLLYVNDTKTNAAKNAALSGAGFTAEMQYVLVNDTQYGGGGGLYAVYAAGNSSARDVALHEVAHSFAGLADEYGGNTGTYTGTEPGAINVTKNSSGAKWAEWLGYNDPILGVIGAYEGGAYYDHGVYRPSFESKMRALDRPFDAIAREEFIHKFYQFVDPLDAYDSNTGTKFDVRTLSVTVIDPAVIRVDWTVNGQLFANSGQAFGFAEHGFGNGTYSVTARAYDPTDWVRGDRSDLQQSVTWNVIEAFQVATPGDTNADGTSDVFWRNNTSGHVGSWEIHNNVQTWHDLGGSGVDHKVVGSGDFNGDRTTDLFWRNDASGHVGIWEMHNGVPTWRDLGGSGVDHKVVGVGFFNSDSTSDLLWRNDSSGHVGIWEMHNNVQTWRDLGGSGVDHKVVGIGDFNGDHTSDILWRNDSSGHVGIWEMHDNVPTWRDLGGSGVDHKVVGIGDFNGDNTSDILWRNDSSGHVGIWEMHNNVPTWRDLGGSGVDHKVVGVGYYNTDNPSDIFWRNDSTGHTGIWEMHNNVQTWRDLGGSGVDHSFIV